MAQLVDYIKNTELYILKGCILWYVNYISIVKNLHDALFLKEQYAPASAYYF